MKNITASELVDAILKKQKKDNDLLVAYAHALGSLEGIVDAYMCIHQDSPLQQMITNKLVSLEQEAA